MKRIFAALALLAFSLPAFAQTDNPDATTDDIKKPSRDYVMLQFGYDSWTNVPDSIKLTGIGRSFGGYLCYDFPIQKSNFSFAAGLGIGANAVFLKDQQAIFTDSSATGVRFVPEQENYKRFKLATTYLEAPFELRYFGNKDNRNRGFKAAVGFRVGTLIGAHTKGVRSVAGAGVADKENTKRFYEKWRYAATLRLGWGNFSIFGAYNINALFKEGQGPQVKPYSIGLCISGL